VPGRYACPPRARRPYLQLLLWVNSPGVIGIVALQAPAAFVVWRYFRRNTHTKSAARTVAAPRAAGILLSGSNLRAGTDRGAGSRARADRCRVLRHPATAGCCPEARRPQAAALVAALADGMFGAALALIIGQSRGIPSP
jgi:hypothetical protein